MEGGRASLGLLLVDLYLLDDELYCPLSLVLLLRIIYMESYSSGTPDNRLRWEIKIGVVGWQLGSVR